MNFLITFRGIFCCVLMLCARGVCDVCFLLVMDEDRAIFVHLFLHLFFILKMINGLRVCFANIRW